MDSLNTVTFESVVLRGIFTVPILAARTISCMSSFIEDKDHSREYRGTMSWMNPTLWDERLSWHFHSCLRRIRQLPRAPRYFPDEEFRFTCSDFVSYVTVDCNGTLIVGTNNGFIEVWKPDIAQGTDKSGTHQHERGYRSQVSSASSIRLSNNGYCPVKIKMQS